MRVNDERRKRSGIDPSATRSNDATSAVRLPVGRHRAPARPHPAIRPLSATIAALRARTPLRFLVAAGLAGSLGFIAFSESRAAMPDHESIQAALADRAAAATDEAASRGRARLPTSSPDQSATAAATAAATPAESSPTPEKPTPAKPSPTPAKPSPTPAKPTPVAGLTQAQMENAHIIVQVGLELKLPRRALVIAIATAMQESNLYNLASGVLPESRNYPHQGTGWDHDSVGLFQQRSSTGWGAVGDLMQPEYAAEKFYRALQQIPGWSEMSLSAAAQAVQVSAFPGAYAKHEARATTIVDALLAAPPPIS